VSCPLMETKCSSHSKPVLVSEAYMVGDIICPDLTSAMNVCI
jgi:hypothetical protein